MRLKNNRTKGRLVAIDTAMDAWDKKSWQQLKSVSTKNDSGFFFKKKNCAHERSQYPSLNFNKK